MTEIRRIDSDKVRKLCIDNNWFDKGNNKKYNEMFYFIYDLEDEEGSVSLDNIATIAKMIINNTTLWFDGKDKDISAETYDKLFDVTYTHIIYCIVNECCYTLIQL